MAHRTGAGRAAALRRATLLPMGLHEFGWDDAFAQSFAQQASASDVMPARVAIEFNYIYRIVFERGETDAVLSGRFKHQAQRRSELPAVGDWVVARRRPGETRAAIIGLLPRRTWFSRGMAGQVTDEQIVAANVDVVFIVMGLDADFNLRRLERYLLLGRESGATPVILLTKPDLVTDAGGQVAAVDAMAGGVPAHVLSPKFNEGLASLDAYLAPGRTAALLGSSGVGKTTIINRLLGADVRKTREVRESDSKGRHTTTHRELVLLPRGGLIIDTPGMRELQLWDVGDAVRETFDDIERLAQDCRFTDCQHRDEPRCAVRLAVAHGSLAEDRLNSYLQLQEEVAVLERQRDERAQLEEKRRSKVTSRALKAFQESRRR